MPQHLTPPRPQQQPVARQGPPPQQFTPPRPQQYTPPRGHPYSGPPPTGIQTSWPAHGPAPSPTGPTAYQPGKRSSRNKVLAIAAVMLLLGGGGAIAAVVATSGGGSGGSGGGDTASAVFDKFATALRTHDLNAYTAALCPGSRDRGALTQTQLDQFSDVRVVSEPNESNIGRLEITFDFAGNKTNDAYDVTLADQSGWCVQDLQVAVGGGASTGSS
jgi:hypothetical protein